MVVRLTAATLAPLGSCPSSIRAFRRLSPLPAWCQKTRQISQSYLRKVAEGEVRWKDKGDKIRQGSMQHPWDILVERGFVKDVAGNTEQIKTIMLNKRIGAYVGVDPTAPSMHIGHMVPLMALFWLWLHGFPAVTLVGGSTARIGDPTDRLKTREIESNAEISKNIFKIHYQMTRLWHNVQQMRIRFGYEDDWAAKRHLLNNSMWQQGLKIYDFLKRLGRLTRVGPMLGRDCVKRKMTEGDGLSIAELIYPMIQGWDFWHMYNKLGIRMQIGGSDQFGNIVSGIDSLKLIRDSEEAPHLKMEGGWKNDPFGFTTPLLTDSAGAKLGKTDGNAVWLDDFKTSPYDLYGYFVRRPDDEVERLLKLLTFLPMQKIRSTMEEHEADKSKRVAQHTLAFEFVSLIHGSQRALEEAQQHKYRFGGDLPSVVKEPAAETGILNANTAPRSDIELPRSVMDLSPARLLFASGIVPSIAEGHRIVSAEGAYIAGQPGQMRGLAPGNLSWTPIKMWFPGETQKFLLEGRMLILRKGKHNVRIVELVDDEVWHESKRTYPGQPYTGKMRMMKQEIIDEAAERGEKLSNKEALKLLKEQLMDADEDRRSEKNNSYMDMPTRRDVMERKRQARMQRDEDDEVKRAVHVVTEKDEKKFEKAQHFAERKRAEATAQIVGQDWNIKDWDDPKLDHGRWSERDDSNKMRPWERRNMEGGRDRNRGVNRWDHRGSRR